MNPQNKMTAVWALVLFFFFLLAACQKEFSAEKDFRDWLTNYYQNPKPEDIKPAFRYYTHSFLSHQEHSRIPTAHFFSILLTQNPDVLEELFEVVSKDDREPSRRFFLRILGYMDKEQSQKVLKKVMEKWQEENFDPLIQKLLEYPQDRALYFPIRSPLDIDIHWAIFSATGNPKPIQKIISLLEGSKSEGGKERILAQAAQWSLTAYSRKHKRIYQITESEMAQRTGTTKLQLLTILQEAEKNLLF